MNGANQVAQRRGVLYTVACGAPQARHVGTLAALAIDAGWRVCVVATPSALKWLDALTLAELTGHPVRSRYKRPDEPDLLPPPDAILVAPATSNTVNKWAAGITDTLALGLVVEATGAGLPVVAMPSTSSGLAAYPAFTRSLAALRDAGVTVLLGEGGHQPGMSERDPPSTFPWHLGLAALHRRIG
ncbi:MAG TPA: flavoprotein [Mycobacteriales bacterium]|nr:flavoprotein [Mycobacteriales bacterium]